MPVYLYAPRTVLALSAARDVLLQRPSTDFPFGVEDVRACYPKVRFLSPDAFPKEYRNALAQKEAFCMPSEYMGTKYDLIFINSARAISQRVRWSIMHELGHLSLYHFHEFNIPYLIESSTKDPKAKLTLKVLDREANIFASEVLIPYTLVKETKMTVPEIRYYFRVSRRAARIRWDEVAMGKYEKVVRQYKDDLLAKYEEFVILVWIDRDLIARERSLF